MKTILFSAFARLKASGGFFMNKTSEPICSQLAKTFRSTGWLARFRSAGGTFGFCVWGALRGVSTQGCQTAVSADCDGKRLRKGRNRLGHECLQERVNVNGNAWMAREMRVGCTSERGAEPFSNPSVRRSYRRAPTNASNFRRKSQNCKLLVPTL